MSEGDEKRPGPPITRRDFLKVSLAGAAAGAAGPALSACCSKIPPLEPTSLWRPGSKERLLLLGARVVDVEAGQYRSEDALLIRNGRIAALGDAAELAKEPHEYEADLGGRAIIPGMINSHCHITMAGTIGFSPTYLRDYRRQIQKGCEECVGHGVTTVRDMLGAAETVNSLREQIERGELLGPRILAAALGVAKKDGYPALPLPIDVFRGKFVSRMDSPTQARDAVKRAVEAGADFIKTFHQKYSLLTDGTPYEVITRAELDSIQDEAARQGISVAMHITDVEGFRKALDIGIASFEHMPRDEILTDDDVRRFVDLGSTIVTTVSVAWALSFRSTGDPNLADPFVQRIQADRDGRIQDLFETYCLPSHQSSGQRFYSRYTRPGYFDEKHLLPAPDPRFFTNAATIGRRNLMKLYQAGARFGCGNDGGVPFIFPGAMALELYFMAESGFSPAEALRAATFNNARLLGLEGEIGSIEKGKIADLVVLGGDPLGSITSIEEVEAVFQGGALVGGPVDLVRKM